MAKFVFAYSGGAGMESSPAEQQKVMDAWMSWFGSLGDAVVDAGNAFGASCSVGPDGAVSEDTPSRLGGYSRHLRREAPRRRPPRRRDARCWRPAGR